MRRLVIAVTAAAVAGIGLGVVVHAATSRAAAPPLAGQATWGPGERPAPAIELRDQQRRLLSLSSLRGRTVVLAFMNSLCGTTCPLEGRELAASIRRLARRERPQLVVVSVNPRADSPVTVAGAIREWSLPAGTRWLLGARRALAEVWRRYDITVDPAASGVVHSTAIYLIDKDGDERAGFLAPFLPNLVARDLHTLAG